MDDELNPYTELVDTDEPEFLSYEHLAKISICELCVFFIISLALGICIGVPIGLSVHW